MTVIYFLCLQCVFYLRLCLSLKFFILHSNSLPKPRIVFNLSIPKTVLNFSEILNLFLYFQIFIIKEFQVHYKVLFSIENSNSIKLKSKLMKNKRGIKTVIHFYNHVIKSIMYETQIRYNLKVFKNVIKIPNSVITKIFNRILTFWYVNINWFSWVLLLIEDFTNSDT